MAVGVGWLFVEMWIVDASIENTMLAMLVAGFLRGVPGSVVGWWFSVVS